VLPARGAFWGNPDFDEKLRTRDLLIGKVNIWCPHLDYMDSEPGIGKYLKGRANAGESFWWYVCNNPREPLNNLQIDQNAMAHRTLLWQQKREDIQGLLYWHTTYWDSKFIQDPWRNMDTLGDEHYGDGSLLYPATRSALTAPWDRSALKCCAIALRLRLPDARRPVPWSGGSIAVHCEGGSQSEGLHA